jgi:hypothetical protein
MKSRLIDPIAHLKTCSLKFKMMFLDALLAKFIMIVKFNRPFVARLCCNFPEILLDGILFKISSVTLVTSTVHCIAHLAAGFRSWHFPRKHTHKSEYTRQPEDRRY